MLTTALTPWFRVPDRVGRDRAAQQLSSLRAWATHSTGPVSHRTLHTDDGARLHVRSGGNPAAAVTTILVHGLTANLGEYDLQLPALARDTHLHAYDQRGHGQSSWMPHPDLIARLGDDLRAVIDTVADDRPIVLIGHSLGGISIMSLALRHPEIIGTRVRGAMLLATSVGGLSVPVASTPVAYLPPSALISPGAQALLRMLQPLQPPGTWLGWLRIRALLFGTRDADPALIRQVQTMLEATPAAVALAFAPGLLRMNLRQSLHVLAGIDTTVAVGSADVLTPARHSRRLARQLGNRCRLLVVPGAGHSVNLTCPDLINSELRALLARVRRPGR